MRQRCSDETVPGAVMFTGIKYIICSICVMSSGFLHRYQINQSHHPNIDFATIAQVFRCRIISSISIPLHRHPLHRHHLPFALPCLRRLD